MAKADAKLTPKNPYLCIKQNTRATQTREKSSVSFLNFSGSALKCPIYKGFRNCHQQTEIFIYDEYRKSATTIYDIQAMAIATLGKPSNHSVATAWLRI